MRVDGLALGLKLRLLAKFEIYWLKSQIIGQTAFTKKSRSLMDQHS